MTRNALTAVEGALKARMKKEELTAGKEEAETLKTVITFWFLAAWKGGVGKSTTVRLMAETCLVNRWPFLIIDTDLGTSSLVSQTYGGAEIPYVDENKNIDTEGRTAIFDGLSTLMDRALAGDPTTPRHVIFDIGAGEIMRFIEMVEKEGLFQRMQDEGHKIRFVVPIDGTDDSIVGMTMLIEDTIATGYLGIYTIDVSVFLNAAFGVEPDKAAASRVALIDLKRDFPLWLNADERKAAQNAGWQEVHLPVLESTTAFTRWHSGNRALAARGEPLLSMSAWARKVEPESRRDQFQMTRWINRFVPHLAKWMV